MKNGKNYSRVFNRMCHIVSLTTKLTEAIDELILNILIIDPTLKPKGTRKVIDAIEQYFGIQLNFRDVEASIERHIINGTFTGSGDILDIAQQKRVQVLERFENANNLEQDVKNKAHV